MANQTHLNEDIIMGIRNGILFKAIENRRVPLVAEMLKEGKLNLNAREPTTNLTFLQVNAIHGNPTITKLLVRAGCMINATDNEGNTALHLAIITDQFKVASKLIKLGADVDIKNDIGATPLQAAVMAMAPDRNANKALVLTIVKMLLKARANVNTTNSSGFAPIDYAASMNSLELMGTLIYAGADVNIKCNNGETALYTAIASCDGAIVLLLLKHGASVDVIANSGYTPLGLAAKLNDNNSHEFIIKKLVDFGSDVNYVNEEGWTPFHDMISRCNFETLSLCMDKVDMKQQSLAVSSLLHTVAFNDDQSVIHLVLDKGIPVDVKTDGSGDTPLFLACNKIRTEYVRQLIARGADVNVKNKFGATPLLVSVVCALFIDENESHSLEESKKVIKLLLEAGSDLNQKIIYRGEQTVLEVLIDQKKFELVNMIIQHASKIEVKSNKPLFDEYNLRLIKADPAVASYYASCQIELKAMKSRKIGDTLVTYFSILVEPLKVLTGYVRNDELVKIFEASDYETAFAIHSSELKQKFEEARYIQCRKEKVICFLSETTQLADPTSEIFENVFKYLRQADIDMIINSEVFED